MKVYFNRLILFLGGLFISVQAFSQQGLTPAQIDSLVDKTMKTFHIPGMAVAVLKDGEAVIKKGYGVSAAETGQPVDTQTLFGIASNTKAFTSAALAQLIDAGKLEWDTQVTDIIPEFKLYDPYVTREFTVRDLLTHRSGLGLGAGDLMLWPTSNITTLDEMIHNLRYLKPVSSFRTKYDYDNLLYIVAGEVVARVSGQSYEDYITQHLFKVLGMDRANLNLDKLAADKNKIYGHSMIEGKLEAYKGRPYSDITKAAGGIFASINDMTKWVQARLQMGKYGPGEKDRLFSEAQAAEMWTPQTIIGTGKDEYNTHFKAYGLGWRLQDVNGYLQVWHTGGLSGIVSKVTLIPELNLGIIVLTNQEVGAAYEAVTNSILDAYFGIQNQDRIQQYQDSRTRAFAYAKTIEDEVEKTISDSENQQRKSPDPDILTGVYKDPWFGEVHITNKNGQLRFSSVQSPELTGPLQFYKGTTYVVKWDRRSISADAFVNFNLNTSGQASGFTMEAISPLTDFSYDFQDLDFSKL